MPRLTALLLCLLISSDALTQKLSKPEQLAQNLAYRFCSFHQLTYFWFDIYDAYLCANNLAEFAPVKIYQQRFSLLLQYQRDFSKQQLIDSSIEEIQRYYSITVREQQIYRRLLDSFYVDVAEGDIIEARFQPPHSLELLHNGNSIGTIEQAQFVRHFLDIWLFPQHRFADFSSDLFTPNQ